MKVCVAAREGVHVKVVFVLIFSTGVVWGCGARHGATAHPSGPDAEVAGSGAAAGVPTSKTLEEYTGKMRTLSNEARPAPSKPRAQTLEATDKGLGSALETAVLTPSPRTYRAVAAEYRRLNVFDQAHHYLSQAVAMDPTDGATYDAIARLWRDAGFPQLGLTDAHRAVYYAPKSAVTRNTLGTVLQALGHRAQARDQYLKALELDPTAAFVHNNLCYSYVLEGQPAMAVASCERALALQPEMTAARNNLGLALAAAGKAAAAQQAFAAGGDRAAAAYNKGIVHLAQRQYGSAVAAFQEAHALRPAMSNAFVRAQQARAAAVANGEE